MLAASFPEIFNRLDLLTVVVHARACTTFNSSLSFHGVLLSQSLNQKTSRVGNHDQRSHSIQYTGQRAPQIFGIQRSEAFIKQDQVRAL